MLIDSGSASAPTPKCAIDSSYDHPLVIDLLNLGLREILHSLLKKTPMQSSAHYSGTVRNNIPSYLSDPWSPIPDQESCIQFIEVKARQRMNKDLGQGRES